MKRTIELSPIKETTEDFDIVEAKIKALFRRKIYFPILRELAAPQKTIQNRRYTLTDAIISGRITYEQGAFMGKFSAEITKELKRLGAKWEPKRQAFVLQRADLPEDVMDSIRASDARFQGKLEAIDKKLAQIFPEEIAQELSVSKNFDRTLWKTDKALEHSVKGITVVPKLSDATRAKIADEWQTNMRLYIKDFTEKEIVKLRSQIQESAFAGRRYDSAIKTIQKSYEVSSNKAKFLASQETRLLMTTFKESRYAEAGVTEYLWQSVTGTATHPVRPRHKKLAEESRAGKIFKFSEPPITSEPGEPTRRNNPGQDYNCRCVAKPIVRFSK